MAAKAILILCTQALFMQAALAQCIGALGFGGCGAFTPAASTGGSFVTTSASPIPPIGVTVVSENVYEGALCIGGNLPLLGSVGLEGEFPTCGAGAVSYGCGDGAVGIVAEDGPILTGIVAPGYGPGYGFAYGGAPYGGAPYGFGYGIGYGLGYGLGYGGGYGLGYSAVPFSLGYGGYGLGVIY